MHALYQLLEFNKTNKYAGAAIGVKLLTVKGKYCKILIE